MDIRAIQRPTEYGDGLEVIARSWRAAFADIVSEAAIEEVEALADGDIDEQYATIADVERRVSLIATVDGTVRGTALFIWHPDFVGSYVTDGEAQLRTLYVHPDHWGGGIGTGLLDAGIERLPSSIERLKLETFVDNEAGRSFYEGRGFTRIGTATFEIGGDAYPTVVYDRRL